VFQGLSKLQNRLLRLFFILLTILVFEVGFIIITPPVSAVDKPNVVFILSDDQPPDLLKTMSYTNGRTDWVRFNKAYLNNPLCCPSRATLLTGQYSHHHKVEENNLPSQLDESNTLATWLKGAGYKTGLIGKYFNGYPFGRGAYKPAGWDSWQAFVGEGQYYDYRLFENGTTRSYGSDVSHYSTDVLSQKAVNFINGSTSQPFFLYFAPKAPHGPFNVPTPRHTNDPKCSAVGTSTWDRPNFNEADVTDKPNYIKNKALLNSSTERTHRKKQCEMLQSVDDGVRSIFTALQNKGKLDNTVVVYMTDNGYANGSHRLAPKRCEYEECVTTPLLIRYPGTTGRQSNKLVSNVDIASTVSQLAGATPQRKQDGYSLVPFLQPTPPSQWPTDSEGLLLHYIGYGVAGDPSPVPGYWGIRQGKYKYVELSTGEKELYDLQADPYELQNKANDPAYALAQATLANKLQTLKNK
jgi:N-acetylglucosamine-6-sulfatase